MSESKSLEQCMGELSGALSNLKEKWSDVVSSEVAFMHFLKKFGKEIFRPTEKTFQVAVQVINTAASVCEVAEEQLDTLACILAAATNTAAKMQDERGAFSKPEEEELPS